MKTLPSRTAVPFGHYNERAVLGLLFAKKRLIGEATQHRPFIIMPEGYGGASFMLVFMGWCA